MKLRANILLMLLFLGMASCAPNTGQAVPEIQEETPSVASSPTELTQLPTSFIPGHLSIPLGRLAVLWSTPDGSMISTIQTDGTGEVDLVQDVLFQTALSWSSDGELIGYSTRNDPVEDTDIYAVRTVDSQISRITTQPYPKVDASWSPEGRAIVYVETNENSADIVRISSDGAEAVKLTYTDANEAFPIWSPEGSRIAYLRFDGDRSPGKIWIMNSDGSAQTQVSDVSVSYFKIAWSPDGDQIAFVAHDDSTDYDCDINLLNLRDNRVLNIGNGPGCAAYPTWSPDGKFLAYSLSQDLTDKESQIFYYDVQSGENIPGPTLSQTVFALAWAPFNVLVPGSEYAITPAGSSLHLRAQPSLAGQVVSTLLAGEQVTVVEGPVVADQRYWYHLLSEQGIDGWAVEVPAWYEWIE